MERIYIINEGEYYYIWNEGQKYYGKYVAGIYDRYCRLMGMYIETSITQKIIFDNARIYKKTDVYKKILLKVLQTILPKDAASLLCNYL
jgi:hypothetical protein